MSVSNLLVPNTYRLYCQSITPVEGGGGGGTPSLSSVLQVGNDAGNTTITNVALPVNNQDVATKQYVDSTSGGGGGGGVTPNLTAVLTQSGDAGNLTISNVRSLRMATGGNGEIQTPFSGNASLGYTRQTDESALFEYYANYGMGSKNPMTRLYTGNGNEDGTNAEFMVYGTIESNKGVMGGMTLTGALDGDKQREQPTITFQTTPSPLKNQIEGRNTNGTPANNFIQFWIDDGSGNPVGTAQIRGDGTMFVQNGVVPFTGAHVGTLGSGPKPKIGQVMSVRTATVNDVSNCEFSFRVCDHTSVPFGVFSGEGKDGEIRVNSVGEGAVLCLRDDSVPILAGDYLSISRTKKGYVEKSRSSQFSKWVVGKAIVDVEWDDEEEEKLIPVVYYCG